MIRICHFVESLDIGGLEKTVIQIAANLDKTKYYQEIWCLRKKGLLAEDAAKSGIVLRFFNIEGGIRIIPLWRLSRLLKAGSFDIIHAHELYPAVWAIGAAIFAGVRIKIFHCQNVYWNATKKDKIKMKLSSLFVSKIIAVSEAAKKSLVEFVGVNPVKITVIHNSAEKVEAVNEPQKKRLRQELGIGERDFIVGSISRLVAHKGQQYLIDAVFALASDFPVLKCLIVGDGPAAQSLKLKAKNLKLEGEIIFTGWRKDVANLVSIMDIFVQPSTWVEGLPLALAEAASAGVPLIATNIGGNSEIVDDAKNGFIIPPNNPKILADKIRFFLENSEKKKIMGENSQKIWQDKFSTEGMLKRIEDLYAEYI